VKSLKLLGLIAFIIYFSCVTAGAGDFDGSRSLVCATMDVVECLPGGNCQRVTHDSINLPKFVILNFKEKKISMPGDPKNRPPTAIERTESVDGKLILQGAEDGIEGVRDGLGWTVAISEQTGDMVLTASGEEVGFVVFGACTPQ
jgi:hypothetical protein